MSGNAAGPSLQILPVGPLQCNCSVIGDETTRDAMVIDPGDEIVMPHPSFEPYATGTNIAGARMVQSPLAGYETDLDDMRRRITARSSPAPTTLRRSSQSSAIASPGGSRSTDAVARSSTTASGARRRVTHPGPSLRRRACISRPGRPKS